MRVVGTIEKCLESLQPSKNIWKQTITLFPWPLELLQTSVCVTKTWWWKQVEKPLKCGWKFWLSWGSFSHGSISIVVETHLWYFHVKLIPFQGRCLLLWAIILWKCLQIAVVLVEKFKISLLFCKKPIKAHLVLTSFLKLINNDWNNIWMISYHAYGLR